MTQREREKLDPLIRAADNMAVILENISADEAQFTSEGRTNVTAVKTMTAAMKELISVIRNLNELPSKAERRGGKGQPDTTGCRVRGGPQHITGEGDGLRYGRR